MRMSSVALAAVSVASVGASIWLYTALVEERGRSDALELELRKLRNGTPEMDGAGSPDPRGSTLDTTAPPAMNAVAAPRPGPDVSPDLKAASNAKGYNNIHRRLLASSPEFRKAFRDQQRVMLEMRYRDLQQALGLSSEQATQVIDVLTDNTMRQMEGWRLDMSAQEIYERQKADNDKLTAVLGDANASRFEEYRASMQSRDEVHMLGSELAGGPNALREDQVEPMIALVYVEQQRLQQEWTDLYSSRPDARNVSINAQRSQLAIAANERIVEASRAMLTPGQLAALKDIYRRQRVQMESQDEMARLMNDAMAREPPASPN